MYGYIPDISDNCDREKKTGTHILLHIVTSSLVVNLNISSSDTLRARLLNCSSEWSGLPLM